MGRLSLHDSVLVSARMDWEPPTAVLRIDPFPDPEPDTVLVARDVRRLIIPRLDEWGPSNSIYDALFVESDDLSCVTIELQSGDSLVLEAGETAMLQLCLIGYERSTLAQADARVLVPEFDVLLNALSQDSLGDLFSGPIDLDVRQATSLLGGSIDKHLLWRFDTVDVAEAFDLEYTGERLLGNWRLR